MRKFVALTLVVPVPYAPPFPVRARWSRLRAVPARETIEGMDIVHPRFVVLPKLDFFSGTGYFLGVVRTLREVKKRLAPSLIHVHCGYPDSVGVACAARLLRLPYVVTVHGSDMNVYTSVFGLRPQIRWALNGAAGVVAVSRDLAAKVERLTEGQQRRIAYIPCAGFDPSVFSTRSRMDSRASLSIDEVSKVVVYVGHLVPIKGVEHLVDAWALLVRRKQLDEIDRLIVVGEGVCRGELEKRVVNAGISANVHFAGVVPQTVVANWIAAANLLCLPSHNEGTPNVVVEALASGVPVVASRVGGIPELVRDHVNGLMVTPGHVTELADALYAALSQTWNEAEIRSTVEHLTWGALAEKNIEFFKQVAGDNGIASE
jgi:teichuronic acid biosynthesis glycosyltransferase TuaC